MPAFEDDDLFRDDPPSRARNHGRDGRDDDSWDVEDDGPDDRDLVPDEMTTVRCTRCKKLIFEDSVTCPYCKSIQLADHAPKARWFLLTVILCLFLMASGAVTWILHAMGIFTW
jgi:RNA polymerase subunit RPABC4/transcription elongation factor Spt4